jgi:ribosomal protein S21
MAVFNRVRNNDEIPDALRWLKQALQLRES